MPAFNIGLSALRSSQYALQVVSNNISNANTEGYHRQKVHFGALPTDQFSGFRIGTGVDINYIERLRNQVTEASLTNVISDTNNIDELLTLERQIEAAFLNGGSPLSSELDNLFSELTKLSSAPDERAQITSVISAGNQLSGSIRQAATQLSDLKKSLKFAIGQEINALNEQMERLSVVSGKIQQLSNQGFAPNAELDQRDALLNTIARTIGISRADHFSGELNLMIGTASIQQTNITNQFHLSEQPGDKLAVLLDDSDRPIDLVSGRLDAMLEIYNSTIPKYEGKLDEIATELMRTVDRVHSTGIGTAGSFSALTGSRFVEQANIPLGTAGTVFPVEAGELNISIVDPNGVRRNETITIDPTVDTLEDVAAKLAAIPNLTSSVQVNSNQLQITAAAGYTFDFTGSLETHPQLGGFTGTTLPTFSGAYTGDINQELTFEIEGSGDVGTSSDLYVNVYSPGGVLEQRVNIGQGYEAGTEIDLGDGVKLSLSRGTVVDGEQFQTKLVAEPDETGVLAALGLNTFFNGTGAGNIEVADSIKNNPSRLATGKSGDSADTSNLLKIIAIEDFEGLPGGATLSEGLNELSTELGLKINSDAALSTSLETLRLRIEQEQNAYSGVDINEEMVYLQEFQKSYEAAVRVIQATDDMLNQLFTIFR